MDALVNRFLSQSCKITILARLIWAGLMILTITYVNAEFHPKKLSGIIRRGRYNKIFQI